MPEIISATTIDDCRRIEYLQAKIWGGPETDIVPDHMLLTFAKNGGVVLIATRGGMDVGFAYGFLGRTADGQLKHCSHQAGVLPGEQNGGVGYRLKLAQRAAVLAQGIELMTWTFDPLQSRNAYFNLRKLGAVSRTYFRELYGTMRDGLNAGLPSDRLEVAWHLRSEPVRLRLAGAFPPPEIVSARVLNRCTLDGRGFPVPPDRTEMPAENRHFLQIPPDINAIKTADMPLAIAWRAHTRELFERAFSQGYTLTDFVLSRAENAAFYVLENE